MVKTIHEIRDPIHVFVRLSSDERAVVDSMPFQRLRHIHQLALTSLIYPGATHMRFEHSLGVMELAGRVFDIVTKNVETDEVRQTIPELGDPDKLNYWRKVLRVAALCHDLGHLPFSHAAEKELLPEGWFHERLTLEIIRNAEMRALWEAMTPPLRTDDIAKLAVGPEKWKGSAFSDWEAILAEIIVGDSFGVDRMDYLLRDAYHAGVAYGKFDHFRLIDTLRILPSPPSSPESQGSREPLLGVEEGGLQSAEGLLLARYFMYAQVYFHPIRRIYDIHLRDFLSSWLSEGKFPTDVNLLLKYTDNEVFAALREASDDPKNGSYPHAERILNRKHFRVLYQRNPDDLRRDPEAVQHVYGALCRKFDDDDVRIDIYSQKGESVNFPVLTRDGRVVSSLSISQTLERVPLVATGYVFVNPAIRNEAEKWINSERDHIVSLAGEEL